jgi:WhiB family redox-sensing transcriptional regulator
MNLTDIFGNQDISWMDDASCSEIDDPDIFYPPRDKEQYKTIADEAKTFCNGTDVLLPCPVRKNCLWYSINGDEQHGIWGGLSHRERNALVRKWQKQYKGSMTLKEYIFKENKKGK